MYERVRKQVHVQAGDRPRHSFLAAIVIIFPIKSCAAPKLCPCSTKLLFNILVHQDPDGLFHAFLACFHASACNRFQYVAVIGFPGPLSSPFIISARRCARAFSKAALSSAFFCKSRILAFIAVISFCIAALVIIGIIPHGEFSAHSRNAQIWMHNEAREKNEPSRTNVR